MSASLEPFLGVWAFDPTTADYGEAPVPRSGVYTIVDLGEALWFDVRWVDATGLVQQASFRARLGEAVPVDPEAPDLALHTTLDADGLTTEVRQAGAAVHVARRRLVDADRMEVEQVVGEQRTRSTYVRAAVKQVLVYRRDLAMRKGKIAAQCAHASMAVFFGRDQGPPDALSIPLDGPMAVWAKGRFAKVVLSVETEAELLEIAEHARARGVPHAVITDSGKTEFHGQPTRTTVAVGPAASVEIDAITGPNGLVKTKLA